jgi:hypothetical protein
MQELSRNNFDPLTAERAFSFQIGDRAAELFNTQVELVEAKTERDTPKPSDANWLARQALQGVFDNPYVVTKVS